MVENFDCQMKNTLEIITGKWKPLVLLYLIKFGTMRFSELKRNMPGITQKMLTQHLREFEDEGLVKRVVYPVIPPKVEYSITEYGKGLEPILDAMHHWGEKHNLNKQQDSVINN
ncbi:transcriptional regulator [Bacillus sp. HNG]|uniref:winged helix-turn-helix transcriptional regulator n=1 Tax=Bacillus sp. HNG TaxID=2293325 RepID=UPI000E2F2A8B|nr:helix-turn-helix domain-containing protein [Bacillus sp. HNG]RFB12613.1 transcriptional regulator [Bacillus sp. HNG]